MKIPLHWHTEPLLLLLVVGVGWFYALWIGPWRSRWTQDTTICWPEVRRFYAGILMGYLAVGSPLDQLGEGFLLSAHMLQHMLLIYIVTPLLITGLPVELIDGFFLKHPRFTAVFRKLVHPVVGGISFATIFTIWHFPELYEAALRQRVVHILEHWMMFVPAIFMTWPVLSRSKVVPRMNYAPIMLYAFGLMIADLPLWLALIFGDQPIYVTYQLAPRICWLTASDDMVLGATLMKGFNEVFALISMGWAFFAWYQKENTPSESRNPA
jgi:putative membrane protein